MCDDSFSALRFYLPPYACHLMPSPKFTVFSLWRLDVRRATLLIQLTFVR